MISHDSLTTYLHNGTLGDLKIAFGAVVMPQRRLVTAQVEKIRSKTPDIQVKGIR